MTTTATHTRVRRRGATSFSSRRLGCTEALSFFEHGPGRGHDVAVRILGPDFAGILVVDFYSGYVAYIEAAGVPAVDRRASSRRGCKRRSYRQYSW